MIKAGAQGMWLPELIQIQLIPQRHRQPASAPLARMAQGHLRQTDLNRIGNLRRRRTILREQTHLFDRMSRFIEYIKILNATGARPCLEQLNDPQFKRKNLKYEL